MMPVVHYAVTIEDSDAMQLTAIERLLLLLVLAIAIFMLGQCCKVDQQEQKLYCDMVALHKDHPDQGWPDFHHNYDSVCGNHGRR